MRPAPHGCHAAALGQNAFGRQHSLEVVRGRVGADQNHALAEAAFAHFGGAGGVEDGNAGGRAGAGGQAARQQVILRAGLDDRVQALIQKLRVDPGQRGFFRDDAFVDQIHGDLDGGGAGALAGAALQEYTACCVQS